MQHDKKSAGVDLSVEPIKEPAGTGQHPDPISDILPTHEFSILLVAPRGSGKTTLVLNLITKHYLRYFHKIQVFSPTMAGDSKWEAVLKKPLLSENSNRKKLQEGNSGLGKGSKKRKAAESSSDEDDSEDESGARKDGHKPSLYELSWQSIFAKTAPPRQAVGDRPQVGDGKLLEHLTSLDGEPSSSSGSNSNSKKKKLRISKKDIFHTYVISDLQKIMDDKMKDVKAFKKKGMSKHFADRQLIIFDDLVGSALFTNKPHDVFKTLNATLRHYSISIMMCTQAYKAVPKLVRVNASVVIIFDLANQAELLALYDENSVGLTKDEWLGVYNYCTNEPFSFMMINYMKPKGERVYKNFDELVPTRSSASGVIDSHEILKKQVTGDDAHDEKLPGALAMQPGEPYGKAAPKSSLSH